MMSDLFHSWKDAHEDKARKCLTTWHCPSQQADNFFICACRSVQELSVSTDQRQLLQITNNMYYTFYHNLICQNTVTNKIVKRKYFVKTSKWTGRVWEAWKRSDMKKKFHQLKIVYPKNLFTTKKCLPHKIFVPPKNVIPLPKFFFISVKVGENGMIQAMPCDKQ